MVRTNAKKIEKTTLSTRMGTSWPQHFFSSLVEIVVGHKEISKLLGIAISTQWSAHRASKLGPRTVRVVTGESVGDVYLSNHPPVDWQELGARFIQQG